MNRWMHGWWFSLVSCVLPVHVRISSEEECLFTPNQLVGASRFVFETLSVTAARLKKKGCSEHQREDFYVNQELLLRRLF
jgi:hypothetical protein